MAFYACGFKVETSKRPYFFEDMKKQREVEKLAQKDRSSHERIYAKIWWQIFIKLQEEILLTYEKHS